MAYLRFIDDAGQLQVKTLDSESCVIGRAANCQVVFVDDTISREHARIELDSGGRFRIRDLGSRNKTHVNGELVTETFLQSGDIVRVGARVAEFLDDGPPSEPVDLEFLTPDRAEPPDCEWVKFKAPVNLTTGQIEQLAALSGERRITGRPEDIAASCLGRILLDVQAERGLIALRGDKKTDLRPLAARGLKRPAGGSLTPVSQSFVTAPLLQNVGGRYPQTTGQLQSKLGYAMAAMTAPLTYRGEILGVLYVDRPMAKRPFNPSELHYVMAAGANLGASLAESARRLVTEASREGAAWIGVLRRMKAALSSPMESSATFAAALKSYPGRARCGDFVDVVYPDDQRCVVLLIDGGGHGTTGLAQAAATRAALRAALALSGEAVLDPGPMIGAVNATIARGRSRQVIPCLYIGIDIAAGKLVYVNAGGMPPLLMMAPGRLLTLDQVSLVLGVDPDFVYDAARVDLPESFRLICHSDGFVEATNTALEPVGSQRIHETLLAREAFDSVEAALGKLDHLWTMHLAGAQPDDDATVLVIGRG